MYELYKNLWALLSHLLMRKKKLPVGMKHTLTPNRHVFNQKKSGRRESNPRHQLGRLR